MSKFRILIVDDEEDVRRIIRLALSAAYEVVEAHDGLDALEQIERAEPDFVVLDVMMPLMNGHETCRAIRNHAKFRDLPVLFLSARRSAEAVKEGYGAGADLYMTKPFEPERVVRNVDQFFQETQAKPRPKRFPIESLKIPAAKPLPAVGTSADRIAPLETPKPSPAMTPSPASQVAAPETPPKPSGPLRPRVMIVDDEEEVRELLRVALGKDFEVTTAENGIEAVEKIVIYQPDLIVLDAMLPKMSGYQLCTSLRRNQNYGKTPIIFISAKASPRDQEYCRRLGANDFLGKPFDPQDLRSRLLAYAKSPGFVSRPKKMTLEQIVLREGSTRWVKEHNRDEAHRRELKDFINREMSS